MINRHITFILGAGASMPYGFPSGSDLIESIHDLAVNNSSILEKFGFIDKEIELFANELYNSQLPSIDLFLERRMEFIDIGKICIFICISKCENENNLLLPPKNRKGIYHYLFSKMIQNCSDITDNKISFITFNYDRSLEHFLQRALISSSNEQISEGGLELLGLPIIHVYGSLGELSWQGPYAKKYEPLSISLLEDEKVRQEIIQASKNIKIISEQKLTDGFNKAKNIISESENIIFIGFSFHIEALEKLGFANIKNVDNDSSFIMMPNMKHGLYRGSSLGMGNSERKIISNKYRIYFPSNSEKLDGLDFLRNYVPIQ